MSGTNTADVATLRRILKLCFHLKPEDSDRIFRDSLTIDKTRVKLGELNKKNVYLQIFYPINKFLWILFSFGIYVYVYILFIYFFSTDDLIEVLGKKTEFSHMFAVNLEERRKKSV